MKSKVNLNDPATKGDIARLDGRMDKLDLRMDKLDGRMDKLDGRMDKLDLRMDKLDGRMDKLDGRMDKTDSRLEIMAQQLDWLYHKELNKEEQGLIHDNRHGEIEDKLINHENRIVKVEGFVQLVTS